MAGVYKNVLVWDAGRKKAEKCDVVLNGAQISSVLPAGTAAGETLFDGKGNAALIPGFINAHTHIAMSLLRGLGEDLPLMEWLNTRIWPVENKLTAEITGTGTQIGMMEMLSTGTTSFIDMYFFMENVADAALDAGMRCNLTRAVVGGPEGEAKLAEGLRLADVYHGAKGLVTVSVAPHACYTVPDELMQKTVQAALDKKLNIHFHWLETEWERSYLKENGHDSPEKYLSDFGFMDAKHLLLAHGVWISPEDTPFYAKKNVTVAHNPKSNLKLASGVAHVPEMLANAVNVALGTDGAASNNRLDLWDELRFAALLHKGVNRDPVIVSAEQALTMATRSAAAALGYDNLGLIQPGYLADFVLIDLDQPHYIGCDEQNLAGFIVYAGSSKDVLRTVVNGAELYAKGEFKTIDKEKVIADARVARDFLTKN